MNNHPPKFFLRFFRWFCHPRLVKPIEGDLIEIYEERVKELGKKKANQKFIIDVLLLFRKDIIKPADGTYRLNTYGMLKHNLLITLRSFRRFKSTFLINLLGLSSGLAATMLIYLWISSELKMDVFEEKDSDQHVQVIHTYPTSGTYHTNTNGSTPNPLFAALEQLMPEVEYAFPVKAHADYKGVLSANENDIRANYKFIGKGYFNVFPIDMLQGRKAEVFANKNNILISSRLANGLFDDSKEAIGKIVELKDIAGYGGSYIVGGVFEPTTNSSTQHDILMNYELFIDQDLMQWYNSGTQAHLVLKEDVDLTAFNEKLKVFMSRVYENSEEILYAQPYAERYLYGKYVLGVPTEGRMVYVKLFSIIALFVLAIACINYMNFSTAKASRRIKEIGVKKAIGVGRKSLIAQYFGESLLMTFISSVIAIGLVLVFLPQFNQITDKTLTFTPSLEVIGSMLIIAIITGVISGIYPAIFLSRFKPISALKGKLTGDNGALLIRKGLVIFQFTISVIMIISVVVIYKQVQFIQTKNLGYDKEYIITFPKDGNLEQNFDGFLSEIKSLSGVVNASQMSGDLPGRISYTQGYKWDGMSEEDRRLRFYKIYGGYDLLDVLGIKLKEGRSFSRDFATDKNAIIFNETAVAMTKLENPLGEKIANFNPNAPIKEVIGVIENFHFESLQEEVKPFAFLLSPYGDKFLVKVEKGNMLETIEAIQEIHEAWNPGYPFEFKFLDDNYQALYASEERVNVLSKYFAAVAIIISSLGLLSLTSFSTQQRHKEIAIRKVLGSSGAEIIRLLSKDYSLLVSMAILCGIPVAYFLMKNWLDAFAFRIELAPSYFIGTGILIMVIAFTAIVIQISKSTNLNVSESLRNDG